MRLPYLLNPLYRFSRLATPERIKPSVRGLYNRLNKFVTYGRTDVFTALDIETNAGCNLRCSYCPVSLFDRGNGVMPNALYRKIIDDVAAFPFVYKGRISPHFYGDPLLDGRLPALMRYTREKLPKAQMIIHTNGIQLTRAAYRALVEAGVDGFLITRHTKFLPTNVQDILTHEPDAKRFIILQRLDNVGIFERGGREPVHSAHRFTRCYYVADEIAVDWRGYVVCTNDFFCRDAFGNVNERSLADIWWDPVFVQERKKLAAGQIDLVHCRECSSGSGMTYRRVPDGSRAEGYRSRQP